MARQLMAGRLKELACNSGAGKLDFGKNAAAALVLSLKTANIPVTYKEYADVEHMTIVQAALNDVFAFLDGVLKPAASGE
jgi:hypothetical protein